MQSMKIQLSSEKEIKASIIQKTVKPQKSPHISFQKMVDRRVNEEKISSSEYEKSSSFATEEKSLKKSDLSENSTKGVSKKSALKSEKNPEKIHADKNDFSENLALKDEKNIQENFALDYNLISYLKNDGAPTDLDMLIENATEYAADEAKVSVLNSAQKLSVDSPKEFLAVAENMSENIQAANFTGNLAVVKNVLENQNSSFGENQQGSKNDSFELLVNENGREVNFKDSEIFKNFEITDDRSAEEKIALLKKSPDNSKTVLNDDLKNASFDFEKAQEKSSSLAENESKKTDGQTQASIDLTLNLTQTAKENILSTNNQTAGAAGSNFERMLSQQIQTSAPDFVKAGSIVLRDNKNGSINMNLRPENLGNVKINLNLSDKVITGQIVVQSKEAYNAFKENLDTLKQAFEQSGFDSANLSLAYSSSDSSGGSFNQQERSSETDVYFANALYADYSTSVDETKNEISVNYYDLLENNRINIVA